MKFSIVVTTFNDCRSIRHFISDLSMQLLQPDEVVIADGGSTDDTKPIILEMSSQLNFTLRLISSDQRLNISQGLNIAIKEAKNDLIVILCAGNSYPSSFLDEMLNDHIKNLSGVTYAKVIGERRTLFQKIFSDYFLKGTTPKDWGPSNRGVCIDKKVFIQHGLFLEQFSYAGEDTEFFRRLTLANVSFSCCDNAVLTWQEPENLHDFHKKMSVNAIADWQILGTWKIFLRSLVAAFALLALMFTLSSVSFFWAAVIIAGCVSTLMLTKQTINILAAILGMYSKLYMVFKYSTSILTKRSVIGISDMEIPTVADEKNSNLIRR